MKKSILLYLCCLIAAPFLLAQKPAPPPPPPPPPTPSWNDGEEIFKVVEDMPMFPGCEAVTDKMERKKCSDEKMFEFIYGSLQYPAIAKENKVEGTVVIKFTVQKDGAISKAVIVRDIGAGCGQEALRIVNSMPRWVPGKQRGMPVNVQFNLPVKFKMDENGKPVQPLARKPDGLAPPPPPPPPPPRQSHDEEVFRIVEVSPQFPGCENITDENKRKGCGETKMLQFISENIRYPAEARKNKVEGMVVIACVIEKDGTVSNAKISRDPGAGCGEEALRVTNLMPKWNPGTQRGRPVRVQYNLPVKFKLE